MSRWHKLDRGPVSVEVVERFSVLHPTIWAEIQAQREEDRRREAARRGQALRVIRERMVMEEWEEV